MSFSIYQLILIIGIIQGLLTGVLMIKSLKFQPHQRLLGWVVVVFVSINFRALVYSMGWENIALIRYLPLGFELFLPPLLYTYVCSITSFSQAPPNNLNKPHFSFWLLPLIWVTYDTILYVATLSASSIQAKDQLAAAWHYETINALEDHLILLTSWLSLVLGILRCRTFWQESSTVPERQRHVLLRWLMQIMVWMSIVAVFLLINQLLDQLNLMQSSRLLRWQAFNVFLAITTYYLGFLGYRLQSPRLFEAINSLKSQAKKNQTNNVDQLEQQLHQLMQTEALYLDPELNLKQVAEVMNVPAEGLSFLLNQKLKITFRDYINQHRIEAVKLKIQNRRMNADSILDVALASGFNSQASFYRAFKKFVGTTPLQYNQPTKK